MDFDMSYYKFHGVDRAALLDALGLCDTGEPDPDDEAPYAIADLPNGWFVIRTNNDSGLISDYDRKTLCREGRLVDPRGPGSMLDVPLELVRAVTGFRHDRPQDVRPTPVFTWLAPIKRSLT
ncbi:hypothetical protein [Komagataeibacter europaeus]|uniref:hypothetical protein n=1 Tax=Komagataeibacter europaeus TaxID=33995 RepID=UPI0004750DB8|nr:hypothetical protein [Komagataeibacter europaeus]